MTPVAITTIGTATPMPAFAPVDRPGFDGDVEDGGSDDVKDDAVRVAVAGWNWSVVSVAGRSLA